MKSTSGILTTVLLIVPSIDPISALATPPTPPKQQCHPQTTKQTLYFHDAQTGVPIQLIGAMHYNPRSISQTRTIIQGYGEDGRLGSVVIESCRRRWERTNALQPPGSVLRGLLDNEFQTAWEVGREYVSPFGRLDVVLADEDIDENDRRVNEAFRSSVVDLMDPFGGWEALAADIRTGCGLRPASLDGTGDEAYLDASDLWDPELLLYAPVSLLRYGMAFLLKKPVKGTLLLSWITVLVYLLLTRGFDGLSVTEEFLAVAGGFVLSLGVGVVLLGRVFFVALLRDRDEILAGNIRAECERLATLTLGKEGVAKEDQVCVAVLGLAHCNGVKRLLCK